MSGKLAYLEREARRFAAMYPQGSDGRNTFTVFADKIASCAQTDPLEDDMPEQQISEIDVFVDADGDISYHRVGRAGVVRIEVITKPGMHCDIPYIRVWGESLPSFGGEYVMAEYCQHNIIGVNFVRPSAQVGS